MDEPYVKVALTFATKVIESLIKSVKSEEKVIKVKRHSIETSIFNHVNKINTFSSEVSFREIIQPKGIDTVYTPLELNLNEINLDDNTKKQGVLVSEAIEDVFNNSINNVILLGAPGSGKTTTVKHICRNLLSKEEFLNDCIQFPLLVRFRENEINSNKNIPLFDYLFDVLGLIVVNKVKIDNSEESVRSIDVFKKNFIIKILNEFSPLLILDGLDEISDIDIRNNVIANIKDISLSATNARFILTTRKGDDVFHIENTRKFEIAPLNDLQIEKFTSGWLGNSNSITFLAQLKKSSVYDAATRPLTLAHLCVIFEREGHIPERSRSIYKKIINLLIVDWNQENQIHYNSRFNKFDPDRKKDFLENVAFQLTVYFNKKQFSRTDLQKCYLNLYDKFDLPAGEMDNVVQEIQIHNGLLIKQGGDFYEFAHKSFQEYLTAEHIVKMPPNLNGIDFTKLAAELALAVTLSSEPSDYLSFLIDEYIGKLNIDFIFISNFFTRLKIESPDFNESSKIGNSLLMLHNKLCAMIIHLDSNDEVIIETGIAIIKLNEIYDIIISFRKLALSMEANLTEFSYYSFTSVGSINIYSNRSMKYNSQDYINFKFTDYFFKRIKTYKLE